ncbi:MAG: cytochrome c maturation protein CcmE [Planctomycetes bacterium]|nr:cytochrome c maturation protein CcmE [Planctomycetota bacterium]
MLLLAGVGLLVWMTARTEAAEKVTVVELLAEPDRYRTKPVDVYGKVVVGSISYDEERIVLTFRMEDDEGAQVAVRSLEPKPDAFKEEGPVLVVGIYDPEAERIDAQSVKAKCPSRYEEKSGGAQGQGTSRQDR